MVTTTIHHKSKPMAAICCYDACQRPLDEPLAAMRLHGFYNTLNEAQQSVKAMAAEQVDVRSYIIEQCMRWIMVQEPTKGSALEEEEIQAPENEDRDSGKMGSVCDLRQGRRGIMPLLEKGNCIKARVWFEIPHHKQGSIDRIGGGGCMYVETIHL